MKSASVQSFQLFSLFTIHHNLHDCSDGKAHTHMHSCKLLTDTCYSRCICSLLCSIFFSFVTLTHKHPRTHAHTGSSYEDRVFWLCLNLLYALMNVSEAMYTVNAASRENKLVFFCFIFFFFFC